MKRFLLAAIAVAGLVLFQTNYVSAAYNGADKLGPQSISANAPDKDYKEQGMIDANYVIAHTTHAEFWHACQHAWDMKRVHDALIPELRAEYEEGIQEVSENLWRMVTDQFPQGMELIDGSLTDYNLGYNDAKFVCQSIFKWNHTLTYYNGSTIIHRFNISYNYREGLTDGYNRVFQRKF